MNKTRRNDPCPCGSGKKYKRCCAGAAVTTASSDRGEAFGAPPLTPWDSQPTVEQAPSAALAREQPEVAHGLVAAVLLDLELFLASTKIAPHTQAATKAFMAELPAWMEPESFSSFMQSGSVRERLQHFFGIDFRLPAGQTPIALFRASMQVGRDAPHARALLALEACRTSLNRFTGLDSHGRPLFEQLLPRGGASRPVESILEPERLRVGEVLAMRLVEIFGHLLLIEAAVTLPHRAVEQLAFELDGAGEEEIRMRLAPLVLGQELAASAGSTRDYCHTRRYPEGPPRKSALVLSKMLDADGGLRFPIHPKDVGRVFYEGRLALRASQKEALGERLSDLMACRRRPDNRACSGLLRARIARHEHGCSRRPTISWFCPDCGDGAVLASWDGTTFDASGDGKREFGKTGRLFMLSGKELGLLQKRAVLGPAALSLLLRAKESVSDPQTWLLEGADDAFVELTRGALVGFVHPTAGQPTKAYMQVVERLGEHIGLYGSLEGAGAAAKALIGFPERPGSPLKAPPSERAKATPSGGCRSC